MFDAVGATATIAHDAAVDPPPDTEEDFTPPAEAARKRIVKWRMQASRGPEGARFRREVRVAYDHRCLFSGRRLQKLDDFPSAGVDAAHILPWRLYDLNSVKNGLCLDKLCHWAFDAGVVRLDFDRHADTYRLSVPPEVKREAPPRRFDLDFFLSLEGPIPRERLPKDRREHPAPEYLEALNQRMFGG